MTQKPIEFWFCVLWYHILVQSVPSKIKSLGLLKYFYKGDASILSSQVEIKKNFKALLGEPFSQPSFCNENSLCTDSNIEIIYDLEYGKNHSKTFNCA